MSDNPFKEEARAPEAAETPKQNPFQEAGAATVDVMKQVGGGVSSKIHETSVKKMLNIMKMITILNALCVIVACGYGMYLVIEPEDSDDNDNAIVVMCLGVYIELFAFLLLIFELKLKGYTKALKRNFGFLFSLSGKTMFILFIGSMLCGFTNSWIPLGCGIATMCVAMFFCYVIQTHPGFYEYKEGEFDEEKIAEFLKKNPEFASQLGHEVPTPAVTSDFKIEVEDQPVFTEQTLKQTEDENPFAAAPNSESPVVISTPAPVEDQSHEDNPFASASPASNDEPTKKADDPFAADNPFDSNYPFSK
eukprot:TRINITY_DN7311_c0_g1_i1.p1 TRINITY_DN7311_c0_g1~~TRINITY_DN7311_c0_g1_i1.p1  ORF type:complete len:320 (+),score=104.66 TRINITY_DN7311_c0_g1_i1:44-961(+)